MIQAKSKAGNWALTILALALLITAGVVLLRRHAGESSVRQSPPAATAAVPEAAPEAPAPAPPPEPDASVNPASTDSASSQLAKIVDSKPTLRIRNRMSAADMEKVRAIKARIEENFAKVKTVKFRLQESRELLPGGDPLFAELAMGTISDIRAEFIREPLLLRITGTTEGKDRDTTVTSAGVSGSNERKRTPDRLVGNILDQRVPQFLDMLLEPDSDCSFQEDVPVEAALLSMEQVKSSIPDAAARYDVLTDRMGDRFDSFWFNRETGMLALSLCCKTVKGEENIIQSVEMMQWRKVGDVYYHHDYEKWSVGDISVDPPQRNFSLHMFGRSSDLEVNGIKAE